VPEQSLLKTILYSNKFELIFYPQISQVTQIFLRVTPILNLLEFAKPHRGLHNGRKPFPLYLIRIVDRIEV
jgi:hypothetical protein